MNSNLLLQGQVACHHCGVVSEIALLDEIIVTDFLHVIICDCGEKLITIEEKENNWKIDLVNSHGQHFKIYSMEEQNASKG